MVQVFAKQDGDSLIKHFNSKDTHPEVNTEKLSYGLLYYSLFHSSVYPYQKSFNHNSTIHMK